VAVSFAHHNACSLDTMIASMADDSYCLSCRPDRIGGQIRQRLLSWSSHVLSWVDSMGDALHLMRYEDMVMKPFETFLGAARFAHLPDDPPRVQKAIRFSGFSELQKQETLHGFNQRPQNAASFFRKGKVGSWRESLTHQQVQQIIKDHRDVMKRFGYLNDQDDPVF
jgi:aryl sulfotransferase